MKNKKCAVCNSIKYIQKYQNKNYLCAKHREQMKKYGKILKRTVFDKNEIIDCGDYCEIVLYNKYCQEVAKTKIDKEDLSKTKQHKWGIDGKGYSVSRINGKMIKLHQFIIGKKDGYTIDHKNRDKLDNRKQNLRYCTISQNLMNRKSKGFYWHVSTSKWMAYITKDKKMINLGLFKNKDDALEMRQSAEKAIFQQYAK